MFITSSDQSRYTLWSCQNVCDALSYLLDNIYRKPINNDTFLYQHFKRTGHSPNNVIVQPVEKISYDENSSVRFKNIKRFETELKWIKLLQTPFPLGFNDNIYHEGNISKMPDFDVLTLSESRKRKSRSHGIRKKGNDKPKSSFRHLKQGIQEFHRKYVLVPADKAANNVVVVCRLHYVNTLKQELDGTRAYLETDTDEMSVVYAHLNDLPVLKVFCLCQ